jgi:hypothetical protein
MKRNLFFVIFIFSCLTSVWGMFVDLTEPVPTDRLIKNLEAYAKEHPDDPGGYYTLGRVHSLAFAKQEELRMFFYEDEQKTEKLAYPHFAPWSSVLEAKVDDKKLSDEQKRHLLESIRNYYIATELKTEEGLYQLGLGWMLEQGMPYAEQLGPPPLYHDLEKSLRLYGEDDTLDKILNKPYGDFYAKNFGKYYDHTDIFGILRTWNRLKAEQQESLKSLMMILWEQEALRAYRKAFNIRGYDEIKKEFQNLSSRDHNIGIEAGNGIIRLLESKKDDPKYAWEYEAMKSAVGILVNYDGIITPIVFSFENSSTVNDLLDDQTVVPFDLSGDGSHHRWQWLKADTAILVWDPEGKGTITSGKQLFGSVTWWMFWENGYRALDALDNDRDGFIAGDETTGLAIWQDRNRNGESEPGEVKPIEQTPIRRLSTCPTHYRSDAIYTRKGIELKDGSWLPTYDWITSPVEVSNHVPQQSIKACPD